MDSNREDSAFIAFERLFKERGLPQAIRSDKGEGVGRLSVGAGLLALPYISYAVIQTFGYGQNAAQYTKFSNVQ
jgi:hypothetical protein